jgi:hypothetical protein
MIIKKIIIWGHKLHSHTHSYIHYGFYKAFLYLGYKTLWLDTTDNITQINFENTLFITEGNVDTNIPIREDCYYVLHNCTSNKYDSIPAIHKICLQVYTHDVIHSHGGKKIDGFEGCYYTDNCLYIIWATDLLPEEIDRNIEKVKNNEMKPNYEINFIGMPTEEWQKVEQFCKRTNIKYHQYGGFQSNVDYKENMRLIQRSILAPAIQTKWQVENGYIPCRIFKNISYGKMGITNNPTVYHLFQQQIIYHPELNSLLLSGLHFEKLAPEKKIPILVKNMEYVRDNHTYINRIYAIFWLFNQKYKDTDNNGEVYTLEDLIPPKGG